MMRLISPLVPTVHPTDSGDKALTMMEESDMVQLPLVQDEVYLGLVQENDILDWSDSSAQLDDPRLQNFKPAIGIAAHPYEALGLFAQLNLSVLPVVDGENRYVGAATKETLIKYFAENSALTMPGGIIVLEIKPHNYSLYQIARICENEDVMVLNSQIATNAQGVMEVTLKTNRTSLEPLASSFERHDYKVLAVYGDTRNMEDLMSKYKLLMNYINM